MRQQAAGRETKRHFRSSERNKSTSFARPYQCKKYLQVGRKQNSSTIYIPPTSDLNLPQTDLRYLILHSGAQARLTWDTSRQEVIYRLDNSPTSIKNAQTALSILETLLTDPHISEVAYNSEKDLIEVYHRRFGVLNTNLAWPPDLLQQLIINLANMAGEKLSFDQPLLAAEVVSGISVKASLSTDLTRDWPLLHVKDERKLPAIEPELALNSFDSRNLAYLWLGLEYQQNIIIASDGDQADSKRLLSFLSSYIPPKAKVAVLDSKNELVLNRDNVVYPASSHVRSLEVSKAKETTSNLPLATLIRSCLQENPDYLLLPDCQDLKQDSLVQALVSGQSLLATTSETPSQVLDQLTSSFPKSKQLQQLLQILVVIEADWTGQQKNEDRPGCQSEQPLSIYELGRITRAKANKPSDYRLDEPAESCVLQRLARNLGLSGRQIGQELKKKEEMISWMRGLGLEAQEEYQHLLSRFRDQ